MSPRHRPLGRTRLAAALFIGLLVTASCGSSDPAAGPATSEVRSEPVSGRQDAESSARSTSSTTTLSTSETTESVPGTEPAQADDEPSDETSGAAGVTTGAKALVDDDLAALAGRRIGLIANRASTVGDRRLIDILHDDPRVDLVALFAPEHGVEAIDAAGVAVSDGIDQATGVPIQSIYGDDRSPDLDALQDLDLVVFDLQDAGARFYTYVSTLGLAMQASAEAGVPFLVLDRPNPLGGDRSDGAILVDDQRSFVGLYPIPALHGLTVGEMALAIRDEGWLDGLADLELDVIELQGWERTDRWGDTGLTWTPPSPGLPTAELATLYPATVLLEATTVSFGRGSDYPFGQFGASWIDADDLSARLRAADLAGVDFEAVRFTTEDGATVPGVRLILTDRVAVRPLAIGVHVVHHLLALAEDRTIIDRPEYFDLLAGTSALRRDLVAGVDPSVIVDGWSDGLADWETTRSPYLLYPSSTG